MPLPLETSWSQVSPLLDELLELGEAARSTRIEELRSSGQQGLAEDLRRLLHASTRAEHANFLLGDSPASLVPFPSLVGTRIGGYVIEAPLGGGANGSVWKARPVGSIDGFGTVALKLLHLSLVGQPAALRFRREAAVLARLRHPSIARYLDMGSTQEGQPYLVLEWIEGTPIDEHCDRERLPVRERLVLFLQLLDAVAHAHSSHVVHRDLKPSNILVTAAGGVKLLDFGIAKLSGSAGMSGTLTGTGANVLTPYYGAPEQFRGDTPTAATDVFSLGVILYRLVGGTHPFFPAAEPAPDPAMGSIFARPSPALRKAIRKIPDREHRTALCHARGAHSVGQWTDEIDAELERIVATALQRAQLARYPQAANFRDDLRIWLERRATRPQPRFADRVAGWAARIVGR